MMNIIAETLREINYILKKGIDDTFKINRFGLEDINFTVENTEENQNSLKITLEANGTSMARNSEHIKRQIDKLIKQTRKQLAEKRIYLYMLYNTVEVNIIENYNTPMGLINKLAFRATCIAITMVK